MKTKLLVAIILLSGILLQTGPAWAWKTSVVTKIDGTAQVVKITPNSHYMAAWLETSPGEFTLTVVDDDNGKDQAVTTADHPGGFCWIPGLDQLFYCKALYVEQAKTYRVVYYIYDVAQRESRKVTEVPDVLETFTIDPIPANDGSVVFHMTIGQGNMPSFNVYNVAEEAMHPMIAPVAIGSDFDLSSDGSALYWPLPHEEGDLYFVRYDLAANEEVGHVRFNSDSFIADGGGLMKVDAANRRIAILSWSEGVPRLQMYIFGWNSNTVEKPVPVFLEPGEEFLHYDWKGITGKIYGVIHNELTAEFGVILLDPITGLRDEYKTTDEISYVDYSPGSNHYYYTVVNNTGSRPQTLFIRLEP